MNKSLAYELSGGGKAVVLRLLGLRRYFTLVRMKGNYPETGLYAVNYKRRERVIVLQGTVNLYIDGVQYRLQSGDTAVLGEDQVYRADGTACVLVLVDDLSPDATTELLSLDSALAV